MYLSSQFYKSIEGLVIIIRAKSMQTNNDQLNILKILKFFFKRSSGFSEFFMCLSFFEIMPIKALINNKVMQDTTTQVIEGKAEYMIVIKPPDTSRRMSE
ncbi:hypothetical protein A4U60_09505 [Priestia endophytica]|nr:hypothetical protein A4U60_09505 [Priestia endophytica]